jgi:hypothetical protein
MKVFVIAFLHLTKLLKNFNLRIELCAYSGYKVYPGRGRTLVRPDGKVRQIF